MMSVGTCLVIWQMHKGVCRRWEMPDLLCEACDCSLLSTQPVLLSSLTCWGRGLLPRVWVKARGLTAVVMSEHENFMCGLDVLK